MKNPVVVVWTSLLPFAAVSAVAAATATFSPVGPATVPPGTNVTFDITVAVETLAGFDTADVLIGSNDAANLDFTYSVAWTGAFANVTSPAFDNGVYAQDVFVGGNNAAAVGSSLLLGTITINTTGMALGSHEVSIDNTLDGVSTLGLSGTPEGLLGVGLFSLQDPSCSPPDCGDADACTNDFCLGGVCQHANHCGCDLPTVTALGPRYLGVTPAAEAGLVALQVRGTTGAVSCVSKYVQANCLGGSNVGAICSANADCPGGLCNNTGTLGTTAVYRTPAEWGTVAVRSEVIAPLTAYDVRTDCGTTPGATLSNPVTATTWKWGDTTGNVVVNFTDITNIVTAFQSGFTAQRTLESVDLSGAGCMPNRLVNFQDVSAAVGAFQSKPFLFCSPPCP